MKMILFLLSLVFTPFVYGITANYKVPTTNPALLEVANFKVEVECAQVNGVLNLKYRYPVELTGVPADLEFRQSRFNPNFFFGDNGEMSCDATSCSVKYFALPFDEEALKSNLKTLSVDEFEFNSRLALALENLIDPGGIFDMIPTAYCAL